MGVQTQGSIRREAALRAWSRKHSPWCACGSLRMWYDGDGDIVAWHCIDCHCSQKEGDPCACQEGA